MFLKKKLFSIADFNLKKESQFNYSELCEIVEALGTSFKLRKFSL